MALNKNWLKSNDVWMAAQKNAIRQLEHAIAYDTEEIELHKQAIRNNKSLIVHYTKGLKQAEMNKQKHIKENS